MVHSRSMPVFISVSQPKPCISVSLSVFVPSDMPLSSCLFVVRLFPVSLTSTVDYLSVIRAFFLSFSFFLSLFLICLHLCLAPIPCLCFRYSIVSLSVPLLFPAVRTYFSHSLSLFSLFDCLSFSASASCFSRLSERTSTNTFPRSACSHSPLCHTLFQRLYDWGHSAIRSKSHVLQGRVWCLSVAV